MYSGTPETMLVIVTGRPFVPCALMWYMGPRAFVAADGLATSAGPDVLPQELLTTASAMLRTHATRPFIASSRFAHRERT
jgi:hypothetical protein